MGGDANDSKAANHAFRTVSPSSRRRRRYDATALRLLDDDND